MMQLGYVVVKNGAYQQTYNFPHMLPHALALATEYAQRLAATDTTDAYGKPSVVSVVETFRNGALGGGPNRTGDTIAKWIGPDRS